MQNVLSSNALAVVGFPEFIKDPLVSFIVTLLGFSIGVISLVWARRFRVNPRMVYQMHDYFVVGQPARSALGDIKILFNDAEVPRVMVTQLGIWNAGNTTVRSSDIVTANPPAVAVEGGSLILGSQRLKATREVNDFQIRLLKEDRSRALLEFDYLDAGDGAVFLIIHTGEVSAVKVTGSLRGFPRGLENWGDLQQWSEQNRFLARTASGFIPMGITVVLAAAITWSKHQILASHSVMTQFIYWIGGALGLLGGVLVVGVIVRTVGYHLHILPRSTPKTLSRR